MTKVVGGAEKSDDVTVVKGCSEAVRLDGELDSVVEDSSVPSFETEEEATSSSEVVTDVTVGVLLASVVVESSSNGGGNSSCSVTESCCTEVDFAVAVISSDQSMVVASDPH